jgi:hypothetical protein
MVYALHALKFVAGSTLPIGMFAFIRTTPNDVNKIFLLGTAFLLGLFVMVHGLFTGIEAAVAAGNTGRAE